MVCNPDLAYEAVKTIALGSMNHKCKYCNALKWKEETPGMCCNNGKVQLPSFEHFAEPLNSLFMDRHPPHNHFMDLIRKYNVCFQITSFGAKQIAMEGFMPTFKVQGQMYHLVGSLMHKPDQKAEFLQIYFVGEDEREVRLRCVNFPDVKPGDIVLQSHDNKLQRISEIHRAYDALQYPLMFCHGEDGYSIDIPLCNPIMKLPLEKKVSAASFYAYRIMIRQDDVNHIVYFRSLFSQFLVDMYAKIETERLNFIRNHQKQLRAENYIHLKDAVWRYDVNATNIGQMVVLPSLFTSGPKYMHERTQNAME
ncbi:hypothetical protein QTP88_001519 [Uroleucon formosanum]